MYFIPIMGLHFFYEIDTIFLGKILVIGLLSVLLYFSNLSDRKYGKWLAISQ